MCNPVLSLLSCSSQNRIQRQLAPNLPSRADNFDCTFSENESAKPESTQITTRRHLSRSILRRIVALKKKGVVVAVDQDRAIDKVFGI